MKVRRTAEKVNLEKEFVVGFDVGSEKLNAAAEFVHDGSCLVFEEEFENMTWRIKKVLGEYYKKAKEFGYERMRVVCEPSGGYEKRLLETALRMGFQTGYVSGESVSRLGVVRSNDYGKTDKKDPRTIVYAAKTGCCLKMRDGNDVYGKMKLLNRMYDEEDRAAVSARNLFWSYLKEIHWDGRQKNGFYFNTKFGRMLARDFDCSPFRMRQMGYRKFCAHVTGKIKVKRSFLDEFWEDVVSSSGFEMDEALRLMYERRIKELYAEWERHERMKKEYGARMTEFFRETSEFRKLQGIMSVCGEGNLARLVSETGSLSDFEHVGQFLKYAGLNMAERRSGKYVGKIKISKRGSPMLRKVLFQICCFRMTRFIFKEYYGVAKKRLAIPMKAVTSVMRKFLKMIFGIVKSPHEFNLKRIFVSEGEFKAAA